MGPEFPAPTTTNRLSHANIETAYSKAVICSDGPSDEGGMFGKRKPQLITRTDLYSGLS